MSIDQQMDDDARALAELGYTQELHRGMSGFSNFAVSFSIISILAGCITSYGIALRSGGPSTLVLGWLIVGIMVLAVAAAMAEVCSRYPTAGGLYFWAGRLARKNRREWAWFTGWFNFLGEVAVTAAIDFGCATTWMAFMNLVWGVEATALKTFLLFVGIIVIHALLNAFGVNLVSLLSNVSAWWHVGGVLIIVGALWILPEKHQSVSWTLTGFHNETGWSSLPYVFLLGLLMAQYTYTGYDASAHVAEETKNASRAAPRGIVTSVLVSVIGGFILLYSITAAITDKSEEGLAALSKSATGLPPAQIFLDSLNSPTVAKFLLFIVCVAQFFCGMASVTANSRMSYAFSRDNALPGSRIWSKVNPRTGTPTNSIWLCVVLSIILASPALVSSTAYFAVTSIAVIGLYIAYVIPVLLRRLNPEFTPGPWNLGRWSPLIGWVAVVWVVIICVLFVLPPVAPVTVSTFNYAPVAVLVVLIFSLVSWQVSGKKNFMHGAKDEQTTAAKDEVVGGSVTVIKSDPELADVVLGSLRGRHAFEDCVERLATAIRLGIYPYGSALPPERELAVRMGVSRATLREAIAALRTAKMVRTTRGRGGGTVIDHPPSTPGDADPRQLSERRSVLMDSLVFRRVVEPGAAYLAANLPLTDQQRSVIIEARAAVDAATDGAEHRQADSRLHLAIASVTDSPQLIEVVTGVQSDLHDMLIAIPVLAVNIEHSNSQHADIVDAILAGDPRRARRAMESHCDDTAALLRGLLR